MTAGGEEVESLVNALAELRSAELENEQEMKQAYVLPENHAKGFAQVESPPPAASHNPPGVCARPPLPVPYVIPVRTAALIHLGHDKRSVCGFALQAMSQAYSIGCKALAKEHKVMLRQEKANADMLATKGELSEEAAANYEKARRDFDALQVLPPRPPFLSFPRPCLLPLVHARPALPPCFGAHLISSCSGPYRPSQRPSSARCQTCLVWSQSPPLRSRPFPPLHLLPTPAPIQKTSPARYVGRHKGDNALPPFQYLRPHSSSLFRTVLPPPVACYST